MPVTVHSVSRTPSAATFNRTTISVLTSDSTVTIAALCSAYRPAST